MKRRLFAEPQKGIFGELRKTKQPKVPMSPKKMHFGKVINDIQSFAYLPA